MACIESSNYSSLRSIILRPLEACNKNPPAHARDAVLITELGRSPGEGNDNPLQYSCLGNPMDRGAWRAAVHEASESWTQLSMHAHVENSKLAHMCISKNCS